MAETRIQEMMDDGIVNTVIDIICCELEESPKWRLALYCAVIIGAALFAVLVVFHPIVALLLAIAVFLVVVLPILRMAHGAYKGSVVSRFALAFTISHLLPTPSLWIARNIAGWLDTHPDIKIKYLTFRAFLGAIILSDGLMQNWNV